MNTNDIIANGSCSLPWLHTEINLQANQVRPCCKYTASLGSPTEFVDVWNGTEYSALRSITKEGRMPAGCSACNVAPNVFSYKSYKNKIYKDKHVVPIEPVALLPKVIHITLKNTCNLSCRMCHPGSSSKLAETAKKSQYLTEFFKLNSVNNKFNIEQLRPALSNVEHITITGGEPLIDEDCYNLIQLVREVSPNLKSIVFSTNLTQFNSKLLAALDALPKHIGIVFNISIDGPQHIHNYIRYGFKWEKIIDNIKTLKPIARSFGINSTISAMNVGYLSELVEELHAIEQNAGIKFTHIMSTPVLESHLHANCVPESARTTYLEKLKNHGNLTTAGSKELIVTGINMLSMPVGNTDSMIKFLTEFDAVAGTSYKSIYPEWE